jgi:DNA polymerase-3 subunit delta'
MIPMSRIKKIIEGISRSGRVAGAYLFIGPPGAGKREAADFLAETLASHKQDRFILSPEKAALKIDQIRELQRWVRYGPSASRYLTVIIEKADCLTDEAAAAFLKTLEEPPPGVVFVLLVERPDKILPTIHSRCQKIIFSEAKEQREPNATFSAFFEELIDMHKKNILQRLAFSAKLEKERERIEELLYELCHFTRQRREMRSVRIILDTIRFIKRRAGMRLALDNMCLKLGGSNG